MMVARTNRRQTMKTLILTDRELALLADAMEGDAMACEGNDDHEERVELAKMLAEVLGPSS